MRGPGSQPRMVVLGVGNLIMSDEGVGVRVVQQLEHDPYLPAGTVCIDGGTSTHELLADLEDLDLLVIVDAVSADAPPGTVVRLEGATIPSSFSNELSPHQHGINDLLATLHLLGRAPQRVVLLGVVPECIALGMGLSPSVSAAVPDLCVQVAEELTQRYSAAR